jgi:hypothetical protein
MSDQLAKDIRGIVDDGAPPITLAELELASLGGTPPRPRRRWPVLAATAVAVILIAGGVVFAVTRHDTARVVVPAGPAPAPAPTAPAPTPLGAPLVEGPDPGSTLLTSWAQIHTGWVLIYGDGRVIWHKEEAQNNQSVQTPIYERRLTAAALDVVRSGTLAPRDLLLGYHLYGDDKLWAEPTARIYEPSKYAICPHVVQNPDSAVGVNPAEVMDQLPAAAQDLLRGTEHTYPGTPFLPDDPQHPPDPPRECLEVTREQARTLVPIFDDPAVDTGLLDIDPNLGDPSQIGFKSASGTDFWLTFNAILPHGDYVLMGG